MDSETAEQVPPISPEEPHIKPYRKHCLPLGFVALIGSYLVQFPVAIVIMIVSAFVAGTTDALGMDWLSIIIEFFLVVYTVIVLYLLGGSKPFKCRVSEFLSGLKGSLYLMAFALVLVVYTIGGNLSSGVMPNADWPIVILKVLFLCIMVGIYEEGIFRGVLLGCLLPRMGKSKAGVFGAVFLACAIFGLAHVSFGEELSPMVLAQFVLKCVQSGMLGFFFCGLAISTGNIWPGVFAHAFWDFALMGSGGLYEDPFDVSYVDTSSTGWALVAFYIVMIVLQIPMFVTAAMRIAKAAPTCGWLASEEAPETKPQEPFAAYSADAVPDVSSQAGFEPPVQSQTMPVENPPIPTQDTPSTFGLASTQEIEPGSAAWYARRSPDAPPPPQGWQG